MDGTRTQPPRSQITARAMRPVAAEESAWDRFLMPRIFASRASGDQAPLQTQRSAKTPMRFGGSGRAGRRPHPGRLGSNAQARAALAAAGPKAPAFRIYEASR